MSGLGTETRRVANGHCLSPIRTRTDARANTEAAATHGEKASGNSVRSRVKGLLVSWSDFVAAGRSSACPDDGFRRGLLEWCDEHGRDYPWRHTTNPFHVLTAEVMLQRTRADQVEPVYSRFTEEVSGPADVLERGNEYVEELFAPLGLRWRADQYMGLCRELVTRYGGSIPDDREALMQLPGVGQYAAGAALSSEAFGRPTGALDSNILRVYGRYCGIEFRDSDRRRRAVHDWAHSRVPEDPETGRRYHLALVDFAAVVCVPGTPRCDECPLTSRCNYYQRKEVTG